MIDFLEGYDTEMKKDFPKVGGEHMRNNDLTESEIAICNSMGVVLPFLSLVAPSMTPKPELTNWNWGLCCCFKK